MKARHFWTRVAVRRVDGKEETWFVNAIANRDDLLPSTYHVEVTLELYTAPGDQPPPGRDLGAGMNTWLYRTIYRKPITLFKDDGTAVGRNWLFADSTITRHDGYDFGSVKAAVWMLMEKYVEDALILTNPSGHWWHLHPKSSHICEADFGRPIYQRMLIAETLTSRR